MLEFLKQHGFNALHFLVQGGCAVALGYTGNIAAAAMGFVAICWIVIATIKDMNIASLDALVEAQTSYIKVLNESLDYHRGVSHGTTPEV